VATKDVITSRSNIPWAHDGLICIGTQTLWRSKACIITRSILSAFGEEMKARFAEVPEAVRNTLEVAGKVQPWKSQFNKLHYPVFHPPENQSRESFFAAMVAEGLGRALQHSHPLRWKRFVSDGIDDPRKLPNVAQGAAPSGEETAAGIKAVMDRLETELKVIEKTGFISYFLIVGDFIRYGRSKGVACVARGSAAGSIVTYLLEISQRGPDSLRPALRGFLNPERVNPRTLTLISPTTGAAT